jgi:lactate dehydrogenase-like 2-hydroxyacid dehydrogenase
MFALWEVDMKRGFSPITGIAVLLILLATPLTGCGEAIMEKEVAPTPTQIPLAPAAALAEPVYTVLDPRSYEPEIKYQGLTPRLDTLEGKTVGIINMGGVGSQVMQTIGPALKAAVPGCTTVYREMGAAGIIPWDSIESCDAIILGHNY